METDALVDTGAVKFYLKSSVIRELGLREIGEIKSRTMSARSETRKVFSPVALEIQGRTGRFDVVEVPDALPNIVGQIPLEDLDWVVDCRSQKLIPNPEHKHGELSDEFCAKLTADTPRTKTPPNLSCRILGRALALIPSIQPIEPGAHGGRRLATRWFAGSFCQFIMDSGSLRVRRRHPRCDLV